MNVRFIIIVLLLTVLFTACTKEYQCRNIPIQLRFIGYATSDIDTLTLRRFPADNNFQIALDSSTISISDSGRIYSSNDTSCMINQFGSFGFVAGNDWELYIPAKNKTVRVSAIQSDQLTGKCNSGIFSMDKFGCNCINPVYSVQVDGQLLPFPGTDSLYNPIIFIRN